MHRSFVLSLHNGDPAIAASTRENRVLRPTRPLLKPFHVNNSLSTRRRNAAQYLQLTGCAGWKHRRGGVTVRSDCAAPILLLYRDDPERYERAAAGWIGSVFAERLRETGRALESRSSRSAELERSRYGRLGAWLRRV